MTPLFIGRYFISSSVPGKSFPPETVDTLIFIYSVHVARGPPYRPNTKNTVAFVTTGDGCFFFRRFNVTFSVCVCLCTCRCCSYR